jgi:hypothetical protein
MHCLMSSVMKYEEEEEEGRKKESSTSISPL